MKRDEIFEKIEAIWDECQDRNQGSNEAELDFKESVTDWIDRTVIIPDIVYCNCKHQGRITTAYPLPDICGYCRMAILKPKIN